MQKIRFIKTLPHLHALFFSKTETVAYLSNFTISGFEWLTSLQLVPSSIKFSDLQKRLLECEFEKTEKITQPAEYSVKGDIISLWPVGYEHPIRLSFFGEKVEEMYLYDEVFGRKIESLEEFFLGKVSKGMIFRECCLTPIPPLQQKLERGLNNIVFVKSFQGIFSLLQIPTEKVIAAGEQGLFDKVNEVFHLGSFEFLQTDFNFPQLFFGQENLFNREVERLKQNGYTVYFSEDLDLASNIRHDQQQLKPNPMLRLLSVHRTPSILNIPRTLTAGFISENLKIAYFTDRELNGTIYLGRAERVKKNSNNIEKLLKQFEGNIKVGDYVVHEDYGVAIFKGLQQESLDEELMEFLELEFDRSDQLFVPIIQIEKITKFIGPEGSRVKLSRLGGVSWQNTKKKISSSTSVLAKHLIQHYAKLAISQTEPLETTDSADYQAFVDEFPYTATADQLTSTNEIISDLAKSKPMNRLLVGDVGFGKTEVIMRACFKVFEQGGQVLILSPTTILTQQHFEVFTKRFQNFPISIGFVSRFKSTKQNTAEIEKLNSGKTDILIGTHRLFSNDVRPKRLKLVIVDEEQRFGVKQKEKLRQLNYSTHILSVSATPIPRTLGMALSSLQDLSVITTPPFERKSVKTEIIKENWNKVVEAIKFEIGRDGQVFFLHNQVNSIKAIASKLAVLLPDYKFAIAHGQMSNDELDRQVAEFYNKKHDVLIATTIIESGLDMPNVNTIIIHNAQMFGISQLYQLRGRVGRSDRQAYCYLMYNGADLTKSLSDIPLQLKSERNETSPPTPSPKFTPHLRRERGSEQVDATAGRAYLQRLQAIVENQDLGAGFRVASRDLEIRGAGNLLGEQQSGFISAVGYAMYLQLLGQEIEKLRMLYP